LEDGVFILLIAAMVLYFLVLWAHSLRRRLGLAHLYALLGGITAILSISGSIPAVDVGGITFMAGSTIFYPSLLLGVSVLYLFDGPRAARNAIFAIVGIFVIVPAFLIPIHMLTEPAGYLDFDFSLQNLRRITVSVFATLINLVFLAVAWEFLGASSIRLNLPIRVFLTLLGVMWLDAVLFTTGTYAGTAGYLNILKGNLASRFVITIFAFPFLYIYLHWQGARNGIPIESRPALTILHRMADMERRLSSAQEEISRRRQYESFLQESADRLEGFADASFESIFFSDQGICIDQNRTAERVFGYSTQEAVGRHGTEWIIPEDRETVKANMAKDYSPPYEVTARRKDGTTFPAEIQARMFSYRGKRIRITALRDITDRKTAEEARKKSEQQEIERLEMIRQHADQLRRLALELAGTEEREQQRIALILHGDLQQLLAAMRFKLWGLLPEKRIDPDTAQRLKNFENLIDESIRACRSLSHDLSSSILYRNGLITALKCIQPELKDKYGLDVILDASPDAEPRSNHLALVLYRMVRELLLNCKKHSGVPEVRVCVERVDEQIRLTVCDQGKGFDADRRHDSKDKETGLGLSAIEERIQSLSGRMQIRTAPGEGCSICIIVPDLY
jgi:PAS domain S-box-containing protein